jgi:hypothetical protein
MSVLRVSKKGTEESIYTEWKCTVCEFQNVTLKNSSGSGDSCCELGNVPNDAIEGG